jgi:hypothetical protein
MAHAELLELFDELVGEDKFQNVFKLFLDSQSAIGFFSFWCEVGEYKETFNLCTGTQIDRKNLSAKAKEIWDSFFGANPLFQLEDAEKTAIETALEEPTVTIFDEVFNVVEKRLRSEFYPAFVDSRIGQNFFSSYISFVMLNSKRNVI